MAMRSLIILRRRDKAEPYLKSYRYSVEGFNDWGDGHYQDWFSQAFVTKAEAIATAQETLKGNINREVLTTFEGFERA